MRSLPGPAELIGRLKQAGAIVVERVGLSRRGRAPADGATAPRLPFPPIDRDALARVYSDRRSERAALLAHAEECRAARFSLLGCQSQSFGDPVDWHLDPIRGKRAPLRHWSGVPYLRADLVGDHKLVWELNRHQWLVTLAQAALLTGEKRLGEPVSRYVQQWLDANPPTQGINWASSLEVSFRAIAWTWTLHLMREEGSIDPEVRRRMLESLELHGAHLERFLSRWFSPNTHLTGEALGLLYLGCAWPGFGRAPRWRELGWSILLECLPVHLREDGTYFEQATWYLAYTIDFYLHATLVGESLGWALPPDHRKRLEAGIAALSQCLRPDGSLSLFGDDDGGRLLPLVPGARRRFHDTMAIASAIFERPAIPGDQVPAGVVFLLGEQKWDQLASGPGDPAAREKSDALRDGGLFFLRSPGHGCLRLDAGPHGALTGGHAHADALACELVIGGRPVVVDPGTYSYLAPDRDAFRATEAHNTLTLGDAGSATPGTPFRWIDTPKTLVHEWVQGSDWDYLDASHDGFTRRWPDVRHERLVFRWRGGGWILIDRLCGPVPDVGAVIRFHLAAGTRIHSAGPNSFLCGDESLAPLASITSDSIGTAELLEGWVSESYGSRVRAPVFARRFSGKQASEGVATALASGPEEAALLRTSVEGGLQWSWSTADGPITLLLRSSDSEVLRTGALATTAKFCVVVPGEGTAVRRTIVPGAGSILPSEGP